MVKRTRRNGRPPLDQGGESTKVSVRIPVSTYDELYALASQDGVDVSALIRDAIQRRLVADRRHAARRI